MLYSTKSSESAPNLALELIFQHLHTEGLLKGKISTVTMGAVMYARALLAFNGAAVVAPPATFPPLSTPLLQGSERKPHKLFTPADNSARGSWKELSLSLKAA